jgi:hypothetical protein
MSPEIAVAYAEGKADHVNVRKHGAKRSDGPPARELLMRPLDVGQSSADESMCEKGCHDEQNYVIRIHVSEPRFELLSRNFHLTSQHPTYGSRTCNGTINHDMTRTIAYSFLVKL